MGVMSDLQDRKNNYKNKRVVKTTKTTIIILY